MAQMSLRPAFVLAVLLSLSCSAIAGRHLLQVGITLYQATSKMSSSTGAVTASCTLGANVTNTYQSTKLFVRVSNVSATPTPSFTNPKYYSTSTGATVAELNCTFIAETTKGNWNCTLAEKVSLTYASKAEGTLKTLIDAGLFTNPSPLSVSFLVNGMNVKGGISSTVTSY